MNLGWGHNSIHDRNGKGFVGKIDCFEIIQYRTYNATFIPFSDDDNALLEDSKERNDMMCFLGATGNKDWNGRKLG